jgi:hypothetical protein
MTLGFDKPLYILPFDHRGSFETDWYNGSGTGIANPISRKKSQQR